MKNVDFTLQKFVFAAFLLFIYSPIYGQLSVEGTPYGLDPSSRDLLSPPVFIQMEEVDVDALIEEDRATDTISGIPYRFGKNLYVNLNPGNSGSWDTLDDGGSLWRLGIASRGALSINLAFDRYLLPEGARLFVYTPDGRDVIGAFTDLNNQEDGYFATTLLNGDEIIIEYYEPFRVAFPGELNLWRVTHGYRGPGGFLQRGFEDSGDCNVNVACPQGQCWDHHIRSVGMMVVDGDALCSGFLINTTRNMGVPYFLSADHCYKNPSNIVFWFNWQSPTCQNPSQVPPHDAMSGAVTRARHDASDFWLLQLNQSIPSSYNVYYSGWNRTDQQTIEGTVVGIHHPIGDIKKINWANDGVTRINDYWEGTSGMRYWRVATYNGGTVEDGSSGSPLFDPQGYAIGQLSHSYPGCIARGPAWYGRIGASWNGGGTNSSRLSNWLDPDNTYATTWHGFDPNMNITGPSILCTSNATYTLGSLPPGATATWSVSPARVTPSSGSGTTATFRGTSCSNMGNSTLTFTINRPGCFPLHMSKKIIVNGPDYNDVKLDIYYSTGEPATNYGGYWQLCSDTHYHIYLMNNSGCSTSDYNWLLPSGWTKNWESQNMVSVYTGSSGGGNLIVKARTCCAGCGPDVTILSTYLSSSPCYPGLFMIYPNPADNYVYVDIDRENADAVDIIGKGEYTLTMADNMGMVRHTARIREFPYRIDTGGLPQGLYIVNIAYEGNTFSSRVVIEH